MVDGVWGPWSETRTFDCEPVDTDCGAKSAYASTARETSNLTGEVQMSTEVETSDELTPDQMVIFPNPTDGKFTIQLEGDMANELVIHITDAAGRFIIQKTIPSGATMLREEIDFSDKPAGMYFIHIINGEDHQVGKVVVH